MINPLRNTATSERLFGSAQETFIVRNLNDQVDAFAGITATMRDGLLALDPDERAGVEEASKILRKIRAAAAERVLLPLTVLNQPPNEDVAR